jgi:hypothetical protein
MAPLKKLKKKRNKMPKARKGAGEGIQRSHPQTDKAPERREAEGAGEISHGV